MDDITGEPKSAPVVVLTKVKIVYPISSILEMAEFLATFQLAGLGPRGEKTIYKHQRPGGRSGGRENNSSREVNLVDLKVDFFAAINRSDWRGATSLYYQLNRFIPL